VVVFAIRFFDLVKSPETSFDIGAGEVFTAKERKTARKFGKNHVVNAPQSHITINLSEPTVHHVMRERSNEMPQGSGAGNLCPKVRHGVREHIRHCKSGKIVTVKAHQRGSEPDLRPTRVTA
jgi:hypothetical protein